MKQFIKDTYINTIDYLLPLSGDVDQAGGITSLDYSSSNQDLVSGMADLRERLLGSKNFMGWLCIQHQ